MIYIHRTISRTGPCFPRERKQVFLFKWALQLSQFHVTCKQFQVQLGSVTQLCTTLCNAIDCTCSPPTPRACLNSCSLSRWCHPTISSSVIPFSCLQSFSASRSFPTSQYFTSSGQSIGASASTSVLSKNIQDWFPLRLIGLISLQYTRISIIFSNTTFQKHQFFSAQLSL